MRVVKHSLVDRTNRRIIVKPELEEILYAAAPKLFREHKLSAMESCMGRGIECGDGWFSLLLEAATELEALDDEIIAVQVKEKFGSLSFYLRQQPPEADAILDRAHDRSISECETCGAAGRRQGRGYTRTTCTKHAS